jgi:hypothetical protein
VQGDRCTGSDAARWRRERGLLLRRSVNEMPP